MKLEGYINSVFPLRKLHIFTIKKAIVQYADEEQM